MTPLKLLIHKTDHCITKKGKKLTPFALLIMLGKMRGLVSFMLSGIGKILETYFTRILLFQRVNISMS